jgi:hypothetical protein
MSNDDDPGETVYGFFAELIGEEHVDAFIDSEGATLTPQEGGDSMATKKPAKGSKKK